MEIKPIETRYAGCRFRSRLEARWAVFFDALGLDWEYEAQGFESPDGRYLPDFWLSELAIFVEVKGLFPHRDLVKMLSVMPLVPAPDKQIKPQLLLLGPVPRPGRAWTHVRIDTIPALPDVVLWRETYFSQPFWYPRAFDEAVMLNRAGVMAADEGMTEFFRNGVLDPAYGDRLTVAPEVDAAYAAARSARFEFGESG